MNSVNGSKKIILYAPILIIVFAVVFFGQADGRFLGVKLAFGYGGDGGGGGGVSIRGGGGGGIGIWHAGEGETIDYRPQSSFNTPLIVSGTQEGVLTYKFTDGVSFKLSVPVGSVNSRTAFMVFEGANNAPVKNSAAIFLMGGKVLRLGAIDENGKPLANFNQNLPVEINMPFLLGEARDNLGLYYFDKNQTKWIKINNAAIGGGMVIFSAKRPLSLAVFKVVGQPDTIDAEYHEGKGEVLGVAKFFFRRDLKLGTKNADVAELQARLKSEVGYDGLVGGYFGPLTEKFVKKYQAQNDLAQTGVLDTATRAKMNTSEVKGISISRVDLNRAKQTQIEDIKEQIAGLQARIAMLMRQLKKIWQG